MYPTPTPKIQKPPGWIRGILGTVLAVLVLFGFGWAQRYDEEAIWREPVTIGCDTGSNPGTPARVTPPTLENITISLPPRQCWSMWLVVPRGATGLWLDIQPNLTVFWAYSDDTTYKQSDPHDQFAPQKRVIAAKFYNAGSQTITLPIRLR